MQTYREEILESEEQVERRHGSKQLRVHEWRLWEKSWSLLERKEHHYDLIVGVLVGPTILHCVGGGNSEDETLWRSGRSSRTKSQTDYAR